MMEALPPAKGQDCLSPSSEATSACSSSWGPYNMLIKFTLLTCKTAFQHKQVIICEGYGAPSCPYFTLQAWLPNSPSAILEQELHLLKKQKRAQSRLRPPAVSGTKSPAV